ncbi:thiamine pyrophosphate-binding protein [Methylobacterium gregans]|uniref:Acetolactate synthase large subunit IlvG n=1 Tax=Methylobacterium gregans TaxID=374424 RepID=A0AA37M9J5_9HYPH|nr:thiamine pyrophosphate-binding protein [Methylobacterium gregans]MDQ0521823.1 acetolactate synthase-1/2/3 large subunit [Methylobacterium gregans]GJD77073.1 Acetolactate synthase large subunit IlvG [Methylobacterium gregans]GLS52110.1 thiamine pyrophosphate-requiring enzyme [Methylobacterium gregans]
METLRGADIVARTLEALGVTRIFTLSGNHIMPVFDALLETGIAVVHVRHEAACVHMADAWGRLTGEVGVALVTGGQGHTNGAAALFTALAAESPVLLLSGHAGVAECGRGAFQELAQAEIARPTTKAAWTASSVAGLAPDLARAFRIAREGRPGPVHVSLPVDLLERAVPAATVRIPDPEAAAPRVSEPAPDLVGDLLGAIASAERPLLVCGPALCDAAGREAMADLEERLGLPVVGMESPRGVNDPALGAFAEILVRADLLVLLAKPLDFTLRFGDAPAVAPACRFALVDPDPALLARAPAERLAVSGLADPRPLLAALGARGGALPRHAAWHREARAAIAYRPPAWADLCGSARLHPVELCGAVDAFLAGHPDATLICDGGEIGQWPQALVRSGRRLINGVSGTIGAAIPFAIAAALQRPGAPVVALMGDGTFGFHMAEFDTAVRYGVPFVAVVGNDARWNAEHQIQLRSYGPERTRHCDLLPTRYDAVVQALGGFGACVTDVADLPAALEAAHASSLPACLNVMIESVPAPVIRRPG